MIDRDFRLETGLAEALGVDGKPLPKMRRQNPHMHLLEACLFAYQTWGDEAFLVMADEMVGLFYGSFFDAVRCALVEFFDDDLKPHPEKGNQVEPGHYFEWVWLLKMHAEITGAEDRHDDVCLKLLDWANRHGWDSDYGGIYDALMPDGAVIADTKRIWPFCEALKANALMIAGWPLPAGFLGFSWTMLLALKLALFAGMMGLAALHRFRLVPAVAAGAPVNSLRFSLATELVLGCGVLALVAILGQISPAA